MLTFWSLYKIYQMAVRWTAPELNIGYGVWGELVDNDTTLKEIDLRALTQEIPKMTAGTPEDEPYKILLLTVRWRFTLRIIEAVDADIAVYDALLGKRKLGRYNVQAFNYTSYSGFWSSDAYISPRFSFRVRYIDFELPEIDPPCSEPQDDLPDLTYSGGAYYPWTGIYSVQQQFYDEIGDSLLLFVEGAVTRYRLGITYDYDWDGYSVERLNGLDGGLVNTYIM